MIDVEAKVTIYEIDGKEVSTIRAKTLMTICSEMDGRQVTLRIDDLESGSKRELTVQARDLTEAVRRCSA